MVKRYLLALAALAATGCAALGFSNDVLLRAASPDGQLLAICQETPGFDVPGFEIRLERPDGTSPRRMMGLGDGGRCTEIAWSADGRTMAVLVGHVARVRFVDVEWAFRQEEAAYVRWHWRQADVTGSRLHWGHGLRFTAAREVELSVCPYSLDEVRASGSYRCTANPVTKRFDIPTPIVTAD
jgi:hypothetical protein